MNKNTTINLRVNAEVKEQAGMILEVMGLSLSDAFNLMLHQIRIQRGLPFEIVAYNNTAKPETLAFIERIESGEEELVGPFSSLKQKLHVVTLCNRILRCFRRSEATEVPIGIAPFARNGIRQHYPSLLRQSLVFHCHL